MGLLEKLTLTPGNVTPADMAPVRAVGVSDAAIEDVIAICALFSLINRVADTLNFAVSPWEQSLRRAPASLQGGYKLQRGGA